MKKVLDIVKGAFVCFLLGGLLTACGGGADLRSGRPDNDTAEKSNLQEKAQQSELSSETASYDLLKMEERQIEDQTFQVDINPFGEVMFGSYRPDTELDPLGDATFLFYKDGKVISALEGMTEDNIRTDKLFQKVEAVSFPDYNSDGYQDIIIICSYTLSGDSEEGTAESEIRVYKGSLEGEFVLERELSEAADSALAEKTIQSVLGFMGVQKSSITETDSWKQLYIDFLQTQDTEAWDGFTLIWLDDDEIPELAEIGSSEATGCRIINYDDGEIIVTQLDRLNFTYIERENLLCNSDGHMDSYYDLVYSLVDKRMVRIAEGYYGAEDNSKLQFDSDGNAVYDYEWNGASVSKGDYEEKLNAVYDSARAKNGYTSENLYSAQEMIDYIEDIL